MNDIHIIVIIGPSWKIVRLRTCAHGIASQDPTILRISLMRKIRVVIGDYIYNIYLILPMRFRRPSPTLEGLLKAQHSCLSWLAICLPSTSKLWEDSNSFCVLLHKYICLISVIAKKQMLLVRIPANMLLKAAGIEKRSKVQLSIELILFPAANVLWKLNLPKKRDNNLLQ